MPMSWHAQIRADRARLATGPRARDRRALAMAALRSCDTAYAHEVDGLLNRIPEEWVREHAALAFAAGRRAASADRLDEALAHFFRAQHALDREPVPVVARLALSLGGLYLTRAELTAVDTVIAWAEGMLGRSADDAADFIHLRALLAEERGDRASSLRLYRRAIERSPAALTPFSRALALRNLAASLAHDDPAESVSLYGLALALIETHELAIDGRPAVANAMGYALICAGDRAGARRKLADAMSDADAMQRSRIALYARFNTAIVDELDGDLARARAALTDVARRCRAAELDDLAAWTDIRLAWLELRLGSPVAARARLKQRFGRSPPQVYRDAVAIVSGLAALAEGRPAGQRDAIRRLADAATARGDHLTSFALLLWCAHLESLSSRERAARAAVDEACRIGAPRGFRHATNWWAPEPVDAARRFAPAEHAAFVAGLLRPPDSGLRERPRVEVRGDALRMDGETIPDDAWRRGRSGPRVLRRYFRALAAAHPAAIRRDALADLLWPESEGDAAVRNLYAATDDLRRVLADIPGLRLVVADGGYQLAADENVAFAR